MAKMQGLVFSVLLPMLCSFLPAFAVDMQKAGKNEILDNPFIAFGVNPTTQLVTGYLIALRTAPGRTDECRLVFAGAANDPGKFLVKYLSEIDGYDSGGSMSHAAVKKADGKLVMMIKKDQMGGECEWILPFIGEPRVWEADGRVAVSFGELTPGDWIGVFAIKSKKARFYSAANESTVRNAFLVQGDLIYVYDEKPGWYYVKYQGRKSMTVGWIRKQDTVQIAKNGDS